ncbi:unnamed protein product [Thlaspi arvense]|uniref:Late embryogenesis abundant protein LEA-2 subgroup domain-containing protein n=1 Tax=Thlaspi arvense TaxID=13288 RepID=A0AAU9SXB5_THLAR|nr:unnamed protein product [Thlaspi arvense]
MSERVHPSYRQARTTKKGSAGGAEASAPVNVSGGQTTTKKGSAGDVSGSQTTSGARRHYRPPNPHTADDSKPNPPPANGPKPNPPLATGPPPTSKRRSNWQRICCCCCFWSILIIVLVAAIGATSVYLINHPRPPSFSVPSLRIGCVNLTTASDSSLYHLSSFFNFTLLSENPNKHLTFSYSPFAVTILSENSGGMLATGTVPAFFSDNGNKTTFRGVIATSSPARELGPEEARNLNTDLTRPRVGLEIQMRTDVTMQMGKLRSEGVEIKVKCQGFEGTLPKGQTPTVAISKDTKCKSELSVKLWKW